MTTKKVEMNVKTPTGYDVLHLKSQSDIIDYDNSDSGLLATNVKLALDELKVATDSVVMVYTDAIVLASGFEADTTYTGYPYKYEIDAKGSAQNLYSYVNFAPKEYDSGKYAQISKTSTDKVTIYAKSIPTDDFVIPYVVLYNANKEPAPLPSSYITFNVEISKTESVELAGIKATLTKKGNAKTQEQTLATDGKCTFLTGLGDGEYTVTFDNLPKKFKIDPIIQGALKGGVYTLKGNIYFVPSRTMTVRINQNDSNPKTSVTYHDDAVGMTPKSAEWDEFFGHKPCLLKDGKVVGYLNPNNFAQFEDGSPADITSGNAGDVMIEFPRRQLKMSTQGDVVTVSMTDDLTNFENGFDCWAHKRGNKINDHIYIGAYKGYYTGGRLRSLSGKTPTGNYTIGAFRSYAHANGAGYEQSTHYPLIFRQAMYSLKYGELNSQKALGRGYVDGDSSATTTGQLNTKGMDWGKTSGSQQMKLFGIEDFWGNIYEWIDGLYCNGSFNILTANDNFHDTGSGYDNNGIGANSTVSGYMTKIQGSTKTGFIPKVSNGSETTYYCDSAYLGSSCVARFGGSWADGSDAGAFHLRVNDSPSAASSTVSARLSFYE